MQLRQKSIYAYALTYAVCKYVTFRTFTVINVLAPVQRGRQVNLMI